MADGQAPPAPRAEGPFLVGVTGPIGSGKSLLCRILRRAHGCPVIEADRLGHDLLAAGGGARDAVVRRFGRRALGPDGEIDRARLAALVFRDPAALADLDAISHPLILEEVERRVGALKAAGEAGIILLDAAVLPAWLERLRLQAVVLVQASPEVRLGRLESHGWDREEARHRMAAQERIFARELPADWTVLNDGSVASLEQSAEALWRELAARSGAPERKGTT